MMTKRRLDAEMQVLAEKMKPNTYQFCDMDSNTPYLMMAAMTNSGNVYTLKIYLKHFPESVPMVCVMNPLKDKRGKKLGAPSAPMHVLGTYDGHMMICHYGQSAWTPNVSLLRVYIKCRIWLEMYEAHLQSGKPIDYYLKHAL